MQKNAAISLVILFLTPAYIYRTGELSVSSFYERRI